MRPLFAAKDYANGLAPDSKGVGYPLVRGCPSTAANLAHGVLGDLVPVVVFAPMNMPMCRHVTKIRGAGVPSQVAQPIVTGVSVVVASLATRRAWPDKRQEYQPMDVVGLVDMAGENQHDHLTAKVVVGAGAKGAPVAVAPFVFVARQDTPICACGVSGESGDVRVSNLLAVFWEWGNSVCFHTSDYTTYRPECVM